MEKNYPPPLYVYRAPEFAGGLQYVVAEFGADKCNALAAFANPEWAHTFAYDRQNATECLVHILPSAEIPEE